MGRNTKEYNKSYYLRKIRAARITRGEPTRSLERLMCSLRCLAVD